MSIITRSKNIMETGTVSLTAGTAHADYPLARLYDRDIMDLFKTTAAETTEIRVDQGATGNVAIDTCIIAGGHNLSGETIDIQHSPDGSVWTNAVTQFTGAAGPIIKTFTSIIKRYWRLKITGPSNPVQIAELFFSPSYTWETGAAYPLTDLEDKVNVSTIKTASGVNFYRQLSAPRKNRKYNLRYIAQTQRDNLLELWADYGGYKPFWLTDHNNELFFTEIIGTLNLSAEIKGYWDATIEFLEVLGI